MMAVRDAGLTAAIRKAGGLRKLAAALGTKYQSIQAWKRAPQARLMQVARVTGLTPLQLRPDLAEWIAEETRRHRLALNRERFSLARAALPAIGSLRTSEDELAVDILVGLAACRFVAAERGVPIAKVIGGESKPAQGARALAMALAHVAGRARSSNVGAFFGTSRQNVDNASERYLRARDGDDPEDFLEADDGVDRVMERGRARRAKSAAAELWDLETRFTAIVAGGAEVERKRA